MCLTVDARCSKVCKQDVTLQEASRVQIPAIPAQATPYPPSALDPSYSIPVQPPSTDQVAFKSSEVHPPSNGVPSNGVPASGIGSHYGGQNGSLYDQMPMDGSRMGAYSDRHGVGEILLGDRALSPSRYTLQQGISRSVERFCTVCNPATYQTSAHLASLSWRIVLSCGAKCKILAKSGHIVTLSSFPFCPLPLLRPSSSICLDFPEGILELQYPTPAY